MAPVTPKIAQVWPKVRRSHDYDFKKLAKMEKIALNLVTPMAQAILKKRSLQMCRSFATKNGFAKRKP